jgi:hypothetical protein
LEHPAGLAFGHKIALATDAVAHEARDAKVHGLVDGQTPGLIKTARRKNEEVGYPRDHLR